MHEALTLIINGENKTLSAAVNVQQMLGELGVSPERVAVEVNGKIVRRKDWNTTVLSDRDKIEIVQFVGGG